MTGFASDEDTTVLVRPYAWTGGRTRPQVDIAIEALVATTTNGQRRIRHQRGGADEHVLALCRDHPLSLAEIAAHSRLPIGVARVVISDLLTGGLLSMASRTFEDGPSTDVLNRVLLGLHKL